QVDAGALTTHSFPIERAEEAYNLIERGDATALGVVLTYPTEAPASQRMELRAPSQRSPGRATVRAGMVGAGLWAKNTLLPVLKGLSGVELKGLATATGASAAHTGRRYGFEYATTDYRQVLADPAIDAVLIATRHDTHASIAAEALRAGKRVFVEKPPALTREELEELLAASEGAAGWLMVGFNRRFAPLAVEAKRLLGDGGPFSMVCRVNAGPVPAGSWVRDREQGGGRIVGEVCHFVDLLQFLAGAAPVRAYAEGFGDSQGVDNVAASLAFEDGSIGSIVYGATGDRAFPRERVEVIGAGAVCAIDDFRSLAFARAGRRSSTRRRRVDRGHEAELRTFFEAVRSGAGPPVPIEEAVRTMVATFAIEESLRTRQPVNVVRVAGSGERG
ncbi:MAG: Gfo/Idh/MocA family oxidoreductase, partial [Gemmatimonadetes bacterium]|nr:Gfo/Idh/MocA family oxidoreductase [Gemmatimonadota bacterium]